MILYVAPVWPQRLESDSLSPPGEPDGVRGMRFIPEEQAVSRAELSDLASAVESEWDVTPETKALATGRVVEILRKAESTRDVLGAAKILLGMNAQNLKVAIAADQSADRKAGMHIDALRTRLAQIKAQSTAQGVKQVEHSPVDDTKTA